MKPSDWALIRQIKEHVQNLPDLEVPPLDAHIVMECHGCMEGWGGVCKWKKGSSDPKSTEHIAAYASGRYTTIKSSIDAEIHAVMNTLDKLKIYYLDKKQITVRTDCQAIISFYNKTSQNKPSRVRWLNFTDIITGTGVEINFEHIDGKDNTLADALSRLINYLVFTEWNPEDFTMVTDALEENRNYTFKLSKQVAHAISEIIPSKFRNGFSCTNFAALCEKGDWANPMPEFVNQMPVSVTLPQIWKNYNGILPDRNCTPCSSSSCKRKPFLPTYS